MADFTLASLRAKRRRIHANLRKLETLLAGYHAKLAEVNAAIQAIDPQLWMPPRTYQCNAILARGETPRVKVRSRWGREYRDRQAPPFAQYEAQKSGSVSRWRDYTPRIATLPGGALSETRRPLHVRATQGPFRAWYSDQNLKSSPNTAQKSFYQAELRAAKPSPQPSFR